MVFRRRHARLLTSALATLLVVGLAAGTAGAQALDDDMGSSPAQPGTVNPEKTHIGLGLRVRNVRVPKPLIELFVERAAAGSSNVGIGLELSRRKGQFEVQFGLEYEKIFIPDGIWIDKGDQIPQDEVDFVEFENFGWITAELSFLYHTPIVKQLSVRYGGGAGIGILRGEIIRTDYVCTSSSVESCDPKINPENDKRPYDIPPVMLVVNAIIGLQIRPTDEIFINIEGGLRTVPFFGATAGYYF